MKSKSKLEKIMESGHFAVTGELGPPASANAEIIRKKAKYLMAKMHFFFMTLSDSHWI